MSRAVLAPFESYQKSRVTFVQTVAELATRPQNIEALQSAGKYSPICTEANCRYRCYGSSQTTSS